MVRRLSIWPVERPALAIWGLEFVHGKNGEYVYFWLSVKSLQKPSLRLGM